MPKKHIKIDDSVIAQQSPTAVIDPVWWSVSIYDSKEEYEQDLVPFSPQQRVVFAILWYLSEVYNGGHVQFYSNSTGIVWEDAMNGFETIGLHEGKEIIAESARRFGANPSFIREERERVLDSLDDDFMDLDRKLGSLDDSKNINEYLMRYIMDNRQSFYFDGEIDMP